MSGVNFFLRMRDRVSRVARRVQGRLQRLQGQTERLQARLRGLGGAMPASLGGAAFGALSFFMVRAASDANEMRNQFNTLFEENGVSRVDEVTNKLALLAKEVNRGKTPLMGYASSFQSLGRGLGFTFDEATQMSTELTRLGIDLSSFYNTVGGDAAAMQKLQSGLKGNHEALEGFQVFITQSTLDTRLKAMFGVGVNAASEQQKAMARLQIILESTRKAHGDAARTSGEFANKLRGLKDRALVTAQAYGKVLLPIFSRGIDILESARQRLDGFSKGQKLAALGVAAFVAVGVPMITTLGFMVMAVSALANPISLAVLGVTALAAAVVYAYTRFEWFRNAVNAVANWYLIQWRMMGRSAQFYFQTTVSFLKWFAGFVGNVAALVNNNFQGGLEGLRGYWSSLVTWIPEAFNGALAFLQGLPAEMQRLGGEMIAGLKIGIQNRIGEVRSAVTGIGDEVAGRFRSLLGIQSPSRVFMEYGRMIPAGLERGIEQGIERATLAPRLSAELPNPASKGTAQRGGGSASVVIHVNGAGRPEDTARAVRTELTDLFNSLGLELGVSA